MVLQKRLEYGFNGYQVPPMPRAARSARKRVSSWKKAEDNNRMCAFDLLATVAGKLLLEGNKNSVDKLSQEETLVVEDSNVKTEENRLNVNICDQGSCNKSFFVSEIISKAPFTDTFSCKIGDRNDKETKIEVTKDKNGKPPVVDSLDSNVNLVIKDDDENSSGCTQPPTLNNNTFRPPPRIGYRRIRRLLASKQWKVTPKLNDDAHFNMDADLKPMYRNKKTFYKHQRSLRDYPFKKRRLYELDNLSNFDDKSNSKGSIEDRSGLGATAQDPTFQARDSHVKLKIKSFRVPEFFIEIPETATVGSLKRTVMETVTAIFSGELGVGVMLQGKKIGDDNKTLLQMGICHDNELDALGFTLEPKKLRVSPSLCPEDRCVVLPLGMPKPLTRYSPPQAVDNFTNVTESDHDSAPSHSDSRALVPVRAMDPGALAVVPMRKTKQADVSQRRIRRPFSVSEVEALVQAVEKLGTGRWRDVKLRAFDNAKHRTYVDLKDKWKTLVHTAKISPQQRRGEPVPQELLDRVLAAHGYWSHHQAKLHPQPETCRLI